MLEKLTFFERGDGITGTPGRIHAHFALMNLVADLVKWFHMRTYIHPSLRSGIFNSAIETTYGIGRADEIFSALLMCRRLEIRVATRGFTDHLSVDMAILSKAKHVLMRISGIIVPERTGNITYEATFRVISVVRS